MCRDERWWREMRVFCCDDGEKEILRYWKYGVLEFLFELSLVAFFRFGRAVSLVRPIIWCDIPWEYQSGSRGQRTLRQPQMSFYES